MSNKTAFINQSIGSKTAVLYSASKDAFHLETLRDYIETNIHYCLSKNGNDYRLIAVTENDVEGDAYIESFRKHLVKLK